MACFLGHMSGILPCGPNWAAELTDCTLTDSGPLEHVVRGASVLVTFLELIPRFRWGWRGGGGGGCGVELNFSWCGVCGWARILFLACSASHACADLHQALLEQPSQPFTFTSAVQLVTLHLVCCCCIAP
jgi:hypothetical protein